MKALAKAVPERHSPLTDDSQFDELIAAEEERHRRASPEERIERANREAYRCFIAAESEKDRRRAVSVYANRTRQHGEALRQNEVVDYWPTACRNHPELVWRYKHLIEHLTAAGFKIEHSTLITDLTDLTRIGAIKR